jgi:thiol-disulfide isomerase/thioredoxin
MKYVIFCVAVVALVFYGMSSRGGGTPSPGLKGKLIHEIITKNIKDMKGAKLKPDAKYTFLYFSAGWCGPCHQFTPRLVDLWNDSGSKRDYNVIFVSFDRSENEMMGYMEELHMPWSYVELGSAAEDVFKENFAGENGIPNLILFDKVGKIVAQSYENRKYTGPYEVITYYRDL